MEDFSDLSEEDIQQLIELGILDDSQGLLEKQLAQASSIRNSAGPQMQGTGRIQTAASPLEFASHAMQGREAQLETDDIAKKQQELLQKQVDGRRLYFERMFGQKQQPQEDPLAAYFAGGL